MDKLLMIRKLHFTLALVLVLVLAWSCREEVGPWQLDRVATMLDEGASVQLQLKGTVPGKLEWGSGNESVARVDAKGEVLGVSHGDVSP